MGQTQTLGGMDLRVTDKRLSITGYVKAVLKDAKTGQIKQVVEGKNIIPTVGLVAILRRLANKATVANEGIMTYGAVGDGAAVPVLADTVMENEIDRKAIGVMTLAGTTLTIETFFAEAEAIGTLTKFALFGEDASVTPASGTMFEYIKFSTSLEKTVLDVLTVTSAIVISNA
jgi:hypothetical protein